MQRHTSYLLVILKHERPFKDLPDMVADRLSKMEGVDGSGVTVATFDAVAGKDFVVRAEALEDARYSGDAVEAIASTRATPFPTVGYVMQSNGTGQPIRERSDSHPPGYDALAEQYKNTTYVSAHPTAEERAVLSAAIKQSAVVNVTTRHWTAEELDKYARMLAKGIGENLI